VTFSTFQSALSLFPFILLCASELPAQQYQWTNIGIGGGGGQFTPGSSPVDPQFMIISCDMGGVYRTKNGGTLWEMIDWRQINGMAYSCGPVFHPTDANTVYGYGSKGNAVATMLKSTDAGATWNTLAAGAPWGGNTVLSFVIDRGDPDFMLSGTAAGAWRSTNGGSTWSACSGISGSALGFVVDQSSTITARTCFAGTDAGIFISTDHGLSWTKRGSGLPTGAMKSFTGASAASAVALYCIAANGDVYRSIDKALTWTRAMGQGIDSTKNLQALAMSESHPEVLYCNNGDDYDIYKSADTGKTWTQVYTPQTSGGNVSVGWLVWEWGTGWGGPLTLGFGVNAANPSVVMGTNYGETIISTDGGTSWKQVYSNFVDAPPAARDKRWTSIGLEVTTVWHYFLDPFDRAKQYICYTDIGFARSEDSGKTWASFTNGSPWGNTFYELAFDSAQPGVIFAAAANQHDIPHWTQSIGPTLPGGVVKSTDYGKSWTSVSTGLPDPALKIPSRSLIMDPSDKSLYVAMFGDGIYKSTNMAQSWTKKSQGLAVGNNKDVCSIKRHGDGALFALISARRIGSSSFPDAGGLFKSTDKGENWTNIATRVEGSNPLFYPNDFAVHPADSRIIYLAAVSTQGHAQGGLYRTIDGGANWSRISLPVKDQWDATNGFAPSFDPSDPAHLLFGTEGFGILESRDTGKTWSEVTGMPFASVNLMCFDGSKQDPVWYACTFGGGVWKREPRATGMAIAPGTRRTSARGMLRRIFAGNMILIASSALERYDCRGRPLPAGEHRR
jgi:photosystem II stability/assembly factor-like uncharacterized protein